MKRFISILIIGIAILGGVWFGTHALIPQQNTTDSTQKSSVLSNRTTQIPPTVSPLPTPVYGVPVELRIPRIQVAAAVEQVGLDAQGNMDIPKQNENVAWYSLGSKPGEQGKAVFAGHYDTVSGAPAVFWDLTKLDIGDTVEVKDVNGKTLTFHVTDIETYPYNSFPVKQVFGESSKPMVNLITCGGTWNQASRIYSDRTVVFTELVE